MKRLLGLAAIPLALGAAAILAPPSVAQGPANGAAAFAQCRACHTLNKGGRNGIGPNLNGVFTRPPASAAGFSYSPAFKKAALTWDDKTLGEFLAAPQKKVPGTRMPIGVSDPAKRAAIIAYLKAETAK
jgi:cytochrome c